MVNEQTYRMHKVSVNIPEETNVIFGQTHFVKTVEDLYETLICSSTAIRFGIGFCEASQKRLVRSEGNDEQLVELAEQAAFDVGCGHSFFVYLRNSFPVNVLNRIKQVEEVCHIYCATANPLQVIVAETDQGRGVLAVIDGEPPLGIETEADKQERKAFLRTIGYKR